MVRTHVKPPHPEKKPIRNSWGVYDYYKYYRKIRPKGRDWALKEGEYYAIIREVNQRISQNLIEGEELVLPERMGKLRPMIKRYRTYVKDGKIYCTKPVDWERTFALWEEHPEEKEKRTIVYVDKEETGFVFYDRRRALYRNRIFYHIRPMTCVMDGICRNIRNRTFRGSYMMSGKELEKLSGFYGK